MADQRDIWMHGYWVWDWRDEYQKVERIDTLPARSTPSRPPSLRVPEGTEILFPECPRGTGFPGEWYLDAEEGSSTSGPFGVGPFDVTSP